VAFYGCLNIGSGRVGIRRDLGLTKGRNGVRFVSAKRRYGEVKIAPERPRAERRDG